MLKRADNRFSR